jgi:hypothetical protein
MGLHLSMPSHHLYWVGSLVLEKQRSVYFLLYIKKPRPWLSQYGNGEDCESTANQKVQDHAVCVGPTYFDCIQDRHYYVREVIAAPKHTNAQKFKPSSSLQCAHALLPQ